MKGSLVDEHTVKGLTKAEKEVGDISSHHSTDITYELKSSQKCWFSLKSVFKYSVKCGTTLGFTVFSLVHCKICSQMCLVCFFLLCWVSIITFTQNPVETTCFYLTFPCFLKDMNKDLSFTFPSSLIQMILTARNIVIATGGRPKYPINVSIIVIFPLGGGCRSRKHSTVLRMCNMHSTTDNMLFYLCSV